MIRWLRDRADIRRIGRTIYDSIVAQARTEALYRCLGVPDTIDGRFELLVLHMHLVLERLQGEPAHDISRAVIECFVSDIDDEMREIGIGDLAVPRKVKRAAAAVYERSRAYAGARSAEASLDDLPRLLVEHIYGGKVTDEGMPIRLADYMRQAAALLERQSWPAMRDGRILFPDLGSTDGEATREAGGSSYDRPDVGTCGTRDRRARP